MMDTRTRSQIWADKITGFSGSWEFIGWFALICAGWMAFNATFKGGFDPYPFLFFNLALTIISTLQSPLILLSQNRQNETDRANVVMMLSKLDELQTTINAMKRGDER
jgi:uncharacterized membrane protein